MNDHRSCHCEQSEVIYIDVQLEIWLVCFADARKDGVLTRKEGWIVAKTGLIPALLEVGSQNHDVGCRGVVV